MFVHWQTPYILTQQSHFLCATGDSNQLANEDSSVSYIIEVGNRKSNKKAEKGTKI